MLAHNVSAEVRRAISRGEFAPGQKLNEVALAERFGVSRNTLREAFAMLTAEGLCERIPNRGVFLATPTPEFVTDTFRARAAIEPAALLWGPDLDVDRLDDAQRDLLLDDIDQSLHPQAQMELMGELKRLLESFPEVQLVATTHSPYILDALDPSDVRVFAPRKDGSVACRSLSEHPQAEKMRGVLTAGQLWSLDPEWRWVVGEQ